jgi:hypothetical protein
MRGLLDDLTQQRVTVVFGRVSTYLKSDMDRHGITGAVGEARIHATLHAAVAMARGDGAAPGPPVTSAPPGTLDTPAAPGALGTSAAPGTLGGKLQEGR